jgi:hypothetical protein
MRRFAEEHGEDTAGYLYVSLEDFLAKPDLKNK